MTLNDSTTQTAFLAAPMAEVARAAPAAMVYSPGGTRRQAAFAGISPWSDDYFRWARQTTIGDFHLIFTHGVRHLFSPTLTPGNFQEVNAHRHKLLQWVDWGVAGDDALRDYAQHGWRVRLLGGESVPELQATAARLEAETRTNSPHTLWWTVVPDPEAIWRALLQTAHESQATTRADLIRAHYGEDIPPITLYLAFGKPIFSASILPPLLAGEVQAYWSQQPGYGLTAERFRAILYDYAFLRQTWEQDKTGRAEAALPYRRVWERPLILGLGQRLGPHWYPANMPPVPRE